MKRVLAFLLAAVMTVILLTIGVFAAETPETDSDSVKHIHVFDQKTLLTPPTCQTEGVVVSRCSGEGECELPGGVWTEPLAKVECVALEERLGVREASCTLDGYTGDVCCKWCLAVLEEGEVIPKTGHTPGDWVVDAWNSDETTTIRYRFCTVCGMIAETEKIPTTPDLIPEQPKVHEHVFGETVIEIEPTCQTEGLSVTKCTADGYCDLIGRTKSEVLPKTECHPAEQRIGAIDATCISEGRTGDLYCKDCLTLLEKSEAIPKTAHTLGLWITDELQSNNDVTVKHRFCTTCLQLIETKEIPVKHPVSPFADVDSSDYYFDSVLWAVEKSITAGTAPYLFSPDKVITRAEVVTMLWRAAGSPAPQHTWNPFSDVAPDAYYYNAVLWAVETDVTAGTTASTFSPDALCTRGQVMTMLWRAKGSPVAEHTKDVFIDVAKDDYFYVPVIWAVENDITGGTGLFLFSPDAPCSRAQIVTFLYKAK